MSREHRVLVVEDDEGLRYAMATAFERAGLMVDQASDGAAAVHLLNERHAGYCCVLLDMLMPNIHGSSVVSHIAHLAPTLPVVAVTGYPDRIFFADHGDRHVVKALFVKPVDTGDLIAYVQSRCNRDA